MSPCLELRTKNQSAGLTRHSSVGLFYHSAGALRRFGGFRMLLVAASCSGWVQGGTAIPMLGTRKVPRAAGPAVLATAVAAHEGVELSGIPYVLMGARNSEFVRSHPESLSSASSALCADVLSTGCLPTSFRCSPRDISSFWPGTRNGWNSHGPVGMRWARRRAGHLKAKTKSDFTNPDAVHLFCRILRCAPDRFMYDSPTFCQLQAMIHPGLRPMFLLSCHRFARARVDRQVARAEPAKGAGFDE
jgi:hypothetical protein